MDFNQKNFRQLKEEEDSEREKKVVEGAEKEKAGELVKGKAGVGELEKEKAVIGKLEKGLSEVALAGQPGGTQVRVVEHTPYCNYKPRIQGTWGFNPTKTVALTKPLSLNMLRVAV